MVKVSTLIFMLLSFFITVVLSEKYFAKNAPEFGVIKMMSVVVSIFIMLILITIIVPDLFLILIYGSVIIATFVSTYMRYRLNNKKGWRLKK